MAVNKYLRRVVELAELVGPSGKKMPSKNMLSMENIGSIISYLIGEHVSIQAITNCFHNQVIVDLGAGTSIEGYSLARESGAKAYIGVERFYADNFAARIDHYIQDDHRLSWESKKPRKVQIPYAIYHGDMLDFLARLKAPNSVSIILSKIDEVILPEKTSELVAQIEKALHPKGALLSLRSHIGLDYYNHHLKKKTINDCLEVFLYTKKRNN